MEWSRGDWEREMAPRMTRGRERWPQRVQGCHRRPKGGPLWASLECNRGSEWPRSELGGINEARGAPGFHRGCPQYLQAGDSEASGVIGVRGDRDNKGAVRDVLLVELNGHLVVTWGTWDNQAGSPHTGTPSLGNTLTWGHPCSETPLMETPSPGDICADRHLYLGTPSLEDILN